MYGGPIVIVSFTGLDEENIQMPPKKSVVPGSDASKPGSSDFGGVPLLFFTLDEITKRYYQVRMHLVSSYKTKMNGRIGYMGFTILAEKGTINDDKGDAFVASKSLRCI